MLTRTRILRGFFPLVAIFALWVSTIPAQEEEDPETTQYREDYERVTKVMEGSNNVEKADQLAQFLKERPDSKMNQYVQDSYLLILDNMLKTKNFVALAALSKRFIEIRPRVGETYYFLGVVLRNEVKRPEAMEAFAKCVAIKNKLSTRARSELEALYKLENNGNVKGLDAFIQKAEANIGK